VALLVAAVLVYSLSDRGEKVLFLGDSLTYQSASALTADIGAKGFQAQVEPVAGSGLLDTKVNWAQRARQYIATINPDIVVVEFVGDYGLFGTRPGITDQSPQFYADWMLAAQQLEDILTSRHAQVYWVIGPPVQKPALDQKIFTLDRIYMSLHAPDTTSGKPPTIDVAPAFSTPSGAYSQSLPGPGGTLVQLRLSDGVHFTPAGIERYSEVVCAAVKPVSRLAREA
jgi:hypothetical protein